EDAHQSEYHAGGSVGFRVNDQLRLGASLFFVYRGLFLNSTFTGGFVAADGTPLAAAAFAGRLALEALGIQLSAGMQGQPIESLHIGLSVVSPGLDFAARFRDVSFAVSGTSGGPVGFDASDTGSLEPRADLISPARVRLGIAYSWQGGWAEIDADIQ